MIVIVADYIVKELLIRIKRPNTRYTQYAKQAGCKFKVTTISVVIVVSMEFVLNYAPNGNGLSARILVRSLSFNSIHRIIYSRGR